MASDAMKEATMTATLAELDQRESDGITVSLLWNRLTNALAVRVFDATNGREFEVACAAHEALDTFHHPFAYAASRAVSYQYTLPVASEPELTSND
jgi:hypothetical protein